MKYSHIEPYISERKYIKNQTDILAGERLAFLDGERLGDIDLLCEEPSVCRKVRRIMEKRVNQRFWKNASFSKRSGNRARYETRHHLSNHFKNIFGRVPEEYRICA